MKVSHILLISLLIVGALFVPSVSASEPFVLTDSQSESFNYNFGGSSSGYTYTGDIDPYLKFYQIEKFGNLKMVYLKSLFKSDAPKAYFMEHYSGTEPVTFTYLGNYVGSGEISYNVLFGEQDQLVGIQFWMDIDEWDVTGLTGAKSILINHAPDTEIFVSSLRLQTSSSTEPTAAMPCIIGGAPSWTSASGSYIIRNQFEWENILTLNNNIASLVRNGQYSTFTVTSDLGSLSDTSINDVNIAFYGEGTWTVRNQIGRVFSGELGESTSSDSPYRTGTVTMTDNNGTTITGFEVTAINHYTGEEYTVSTQSDVAVMSLPMDRTIEIRNPQTGVYEEAPVGYYKFFGQSPGYKMLAEAGIQVSVMPEKYGSYQLCDIRVTSESGYITGQHQFQIRSRSDNSILQTGTISAKSATTGEWYNTTVSGGIASLILPYDTSNSISQYAGNYYVYATSPGYKDSDYGTQIVVMPHTVSEIHNILLTPIGGIPPAGNVTLRIQAFSETGTGIPHAEIFIAGVMGEGADVWDTYTASSSGYLTVSVPANSTYDIVASGTGYYDSARRVEVFDTDPSLIEIKLYLSGAPTWAPTTQPTGWVTPTSTQTSPSIQEDNIIGLSVKGLAKGFGIDYDTALLMFGLMIIFGAGGMVMSSVKGGAMEFIAGSIVGTFVAFALGLIPIWIFIIIAVVFGAYVLRVFVQGGQ